jgi:hypothetical protein
MLERNEEIVIEYDNGIAFFTFTIQNIILLILSSSIIIYLVKMRITDSSNFPFFNYILLAILIIAALKIYSFLGKLYHFDKIIITPEKIQIDSLEFNIDDVSFRFNGSAIEQGSLIYGEIYSKTDGKPLVTLFFNFWAGALLPIAPSTIDGIFNNDFEKKDSIQMMKSIQAIDMIKEKEDTKLSSIMYLGLILMFIIPALIFIAIK